MLDLANPAVVFALANFVGVSILCVIVARRSIFAGKSLFMLALVSTLWWLFVTMMELSAMGLEGKVFWSKLAYISVSSVPLAWTFFLYDYSFDRSSTTNWRRYGIIAVVLVAIVIGAQTNPSHQLFYGPETRLITDQGIPFVVYDHGPMIYAFAVVMYLALAGSVAITAYAALFAARIYRPIFRVLLAVALIPVTGNLGYLVFGLTLYDFDPTPFLFAFSLALVTWLIFVTRVLELDSIAKEAVFVSTRDAILTYDRTGRMAGFNAAARELFGTALPAKGTAIPSSGPIWHYARKHLEAQIPPAPGSAQIGGRHYDLRLIPIERPLHRGDSVMGWVLSLRDTTDLLALTAELQAESHRLTTLMEHNAAGILVIGDDDRVQYMNAGYARMLDTTPEEVMGVHMNESPWHFEVLTPELTEGLRPSKYVRDYGVAVRGVKLRVTRPDGCDRILTLTAAPLEEKGRIVVSAYDITQAERAADTLREAAAKAQAANEAKSQFLANMSHEIRTPLNGVLGMAEVLSFSDLTPEQTKILGTIQQSGELLLGILNDVLDMAKIETGRLALAPAPFRPLDLAHQVEALFSTQAQTKGLHFEVLAQGSADELRMGDEMRLLQILQNLTSNAIKFTSKGRVLVRIALPPGGGPLELTVQDSGIGMSEAELDRVFEAFQQADPTITRKYGGTGLGLAILRSLVDLMDGEIEVDSVPGEGTTFTIRLPLVPPVQSVPLRRA